MLEASRLWYTFRISKHGCTLFYLWVRIGINWPWNVGNLEIWHPNHGHCHDGAGYSLMTYVNTSFFALVVCLVESLMVRFYTRVSSLGIIIWFFGIRTLGWIVSLASDSFCFVVREWESRRSVIVNMYFICESILYITSPCHLAWYPVLSRGIILPGNWWLGNGSRITFWARIRIFYWEQASRQPVLGGHGKDGKDFWLPRNHRHQPLLILTASMIIDLDDELAFASTSYSSMVWVGLSVI